MASNKIFQKEIKRGQITSKKKKMLKREFWFFCLASHIYQEKSNYFPKIDRRFSQIYSIGIDHHDFEHRGKCNFFYIFLQCY